MKSHTSKKSIILNPKDSLADIIYQLKTYVAQNKSTEIYIPDSMYMLYNSVNRALFINKIKAKQKTLET